jgi:hypothetical protein
MQDNSTMIDEDYIVTQLMRLIALCEQHDLDLDLLMAEARHLFSGEPDIEESG